MLGHYTVRSTHSARLHNSIRRPYAAMQHCSCTPLIGYAAPEKTTPDFNMQLSGPSLDLRSIRARACWNSKSD